MNRIAVVAAVVFVGLVLVPVVAPGMGEWGGADGEGMAQVTENAPSYEPWFQPVWTPPSGEIESVLFSIQAALGGGIIGYVLGSSSLT